jgi:predicted metalloprotease with PDZ domain
LTITPFLMRFLTPAILLLAVPLPAQPPRISAPIHNISYEVTANAATVGRRELNVTMSFRVDGPAPVILALPAWSPGHYVLLWFAQRVSAFSAESDAKPLEWRKLDYQTWIIHPRSEGTVQLSFHYRADAVDRAVAWTAADFAFFNGTNLFMYPVGRRFHWGAEVTVRTEPDWRVATGLAPSAHPNSFTAANYHDLVDMPFYVGRFAIDSTSIADRWFRLAMYPASSMTTARRDRIFGWLHAVVPSEIAVFGEAPFRNYTIFQRSDTIVNTGGLEHQSSQVDEVPTSQLDGDWSGLYAHELFHAWNVKRLRPADLVPYRYDDSQPTTWLWVSEGLSDYYAALALLRGGVSDSTAFLDGLAGEIATANAVPASLSDASLSAWIGAVDGSAGLYYPKGALAGFLLDAMIRDASDNRHSLDQVMRTLYDSTYKRGRGFTSAEWWTAVQRAAGGRSFAGFAKHHVDGRDPLPIDSVFALAGLRFERDTVREPRLGVATATDSTGVSITQVTRAGAGDAAGMLSGDRLVSIGEVPMTNTASFDAFRARYAGTGLTVLPLILKRGAETITLQLPVRLIARERARVMPAAGASDKARGVLAGIMRGTTRER